MKQTGQFRNAHSSLSLYLSTSLSIYLSIYLKVLLELSRESRLKQEAG